MRHPGATVGFLLLVVLPSIAASTRVATFNASLNRGRAGQLAEELSVSGSKQASAGAAILQRVRPGILLLNKSDFDPEGAALTIFEVNYLAIGQHSEAPISYSFRYASQVNTGVISGVDLDGDRVFNLGNDAFVRGRFHGQYGVAIISRFPIDIEGVRTFSTFLWKDIPGALLPVDSATGKSYYSENALVRFRLSSKSHWDVPIRVNGKTLHLLACHPTPPVFDGP